MKRAFFILTALVVFGSGCSHNHLSRHGDGCRSCGRHGSTGMGYRYGGGHGVEDQGPSGPASAAVGYPYYTLRGPRDFLMDNPPSIGR